MVSVSHSAAPSVLGYQHQTWWGLVELLRFGPDRPDGAVTLELHDDVAWEEGGSPTQLLQVKHHLGTQLSLTDTSVDVWRTLKVWIDTAAPGDPLGPALLLVTTQTAGAGTAVAALRPDSRDEPAALSMLERVAGQSTSMRTERARAQFLGLSSSERRAFLSRVLVIDGSPRIEDVHALVRSYLHWALPRGHEELFLALLWQWWDEQALAILRGRLRSVDVGAVQAKINDLRDQFATANLPTLVELLDVDAATIAAEYRTHTFVQQMKWVAFPPRNLQKAIVDYYRAYTQTVRWIDEDLIGLAELDKFEAELVDEWEREFEFMLDTLDDDADDATKRRAGKDMLRQLLAQSGVTVLARYNEPFFARGKRHILADTGQIGWHPDFQSRLQNLLQVST